MTVALGVTMFLAGVISAPPGVDPDPVASPSPSARVLPNEILVKSATLHLGDGEVVENGSILIRSGKIAEVGVDIAAPQGATVIDASGQHVYPGLIDANSRLLLEGSVLRGGRDSLTADVTDGLDQFSPEPILEALSQGVTSVYVCTDRGLLNGLGAVVKLKPNAVGDERLVQKEVAANITLGRRGSRPSAQLSGYTSLKGQLDGAKKYIESWDEYEEKLEEYKKELEKLRKEEEKADKENGKGKKEEPPKKKEAGKEAEKDDAGEKGDKKEEKKEPPKPPKRRGPPRSFEEFLAWVVDESELDAPPEGLYFQVRGRRPPPGRAPQGKPEEKKKKDEGPKKPKKPALNPNFEVLRRVFEGKVGLRVQAHDAADLLNLIELAKGFSFRMQIIGATEAHRVVDDVAGAGVPVVLSVDPLAGNDQREAAKILAKAGIELVISTPATQGSSSSHLALCAASAVAGGLDDGAALRAITLAAAQALGVGSQIGSLAPGKDADLVIATAPPLATHSEVVRVIVDGETVFER